MAEDALVRALKKRRQISINVLGRLVRYSRGDVLKWLDTQNPGPSG